jgi:hypothetical protein
MTRTKNVKDRIIKFLQSNWPFFSLFPSISYPSFFSLLIFLLFWSKILASKKKQQHQWLCILTSKSVSKRFLFKAPLIYLQKDANKAEEEEKGMWRTRIGAIRWWVQSALYVDNFSIIKYYASPSDAIRT